MTGHRDSEAQRNNELEMYVHEALTHSIIGCAIEVHRHLGPGLAEATYEEAFCIELTAAKLPYTRQVRVPMPPCLCVPSSATTDDSARAQPDSTMNTR